jgi:hypothetical protein
MMTTAGEPSDRSLPDRTSERYKVLSGFTAADVNALKKALAAWTGLEVTLSNGVLCVSVKPPLRDKHAYERFRDATGEAIITAAPTAKAEHIPFKTARAFKR